MAKHLRFPGFLSSYPTWTTQSKCHWLWKGLSPRHWLSLGSYIISPLSRWAVFKHRFKKWFLPLTLNFKNHFLDCIWSSLHLHSLLVGLSHPSSQLLKLGNYLWLFWWSEELGFNTNFMDTYKYSTMKLHFKPVWFLMWLKKISIFALSGGGEDSRGGHEAMEEYLSSVWEANFLTYIEVLYACTCEHVCTRIHTERR